jgi:hypothetical protein
MFADRLGTLAMDSSLRWNDGFVGDDRKIVILNEIFQRGSP